MGAVDVDVRSLVIRLDSLMFLGELISLGSLWKSEIQEVDFTRLDISPDGKYSNIFHGHENQQETDNKRQETQSNFRKGIINIIATTTLVWLNVKAQIILDNLWNETTSPTSNAWWESRFS